jgi:hydrogenase-4 component B
MILDTILAVSPLFLPIAAALVTMGLSYVNKKARNWALIIVMGLAFIINTYLLVQVIFGTFATEQLGAILVNESGVFLSELVLFLSLLSIIYSVRYMSAERDDTFYYLLISLFTGTMVGLIYSFNLIILYMFMEASTVTSGLLVLYGRTRRANRAALIYLLVSVIGGFLVLGAFFILFQASGEWNILNPAIQLISADLRAASSILMIIGFGIKAGAAPFGFIWLPKAHADSPSPVSALLSGILVQVTAFAMIRTVGVVGFDIVVIPILLIVFGMGSMFSGAISALLEVRGVKTRIHNFSSDIKRVLAYSTISEVGFIIMLAGIQGLFGPFHAGFEFAALSAMLIHIYNHGFSKALLFLSVGVIMYYTHVRDIRALGGLSKAMPVTTSGFIIGALSLGMIPPLFGYRTIFELAFEIFPFELNIFLLASLITIVITLIFYILTFVSVFIKPVPAGVVGDIDIDAAKVVAPPRVRWYEPGPMMFPILILISLVVLLGVLFLSGILTASLLNLENIAASILIPGV